MARPAPPLQCWETAVGRFSGSRTPQRSAASIGRALGRNGAGITQQRAGSITQPGDAIRLRRAGRNVKALSHSAAQAVQWGANRCRSLIVRAVHRVQLQLHRRHGCVEPSARSSRRPMTAHQPQANHSGTRRSSGRCLRRGAPLPQQRCCHSWSSSVRRAVAARVLGTRASRVTPRTTVLCARSPGVTPAQTGQIPELKGLLPPLG